MRTYIVEILNFEQIQHSIDIGLVFTWWALGEEE